MLPAAVIRGHGHNVLDWRETLMWSFKMSAVNKISLMSSLFSRPAFDNCWYVAAVVLRGTNLLFLSLFGLIAQMPDEIDANNIVTASPFEELDETTMTPSYYVDEDYPTGPEIQ